MPAAQVGDPDRVVLHVQIAEPRAIGRRIHADAVEHDFGVEVLDPRPAIGVVEGGVLQAEGRAEDALAMVEGKLAQRAAKLHGGPRHLPGHHGALEPVDHLAAGNGAAAGSAGPRGPAVALPLAFRSMTGELASAGSCSSSRERMSIVGAFRLMSSLRNRTPSGPGTPDQQTLQDLRPQRVAKPLRRGTRRRRGSPAAAGRRRHRRPRSRSALPRPPPRWPSSVPTAGNQAAANSGTAPRPGRQTPPRRSRRSPRTRRGRLASISVPASAAPTNGNRSSSRMKPGAAAPVFRVSSRRCPGSEAQRWSPGSHARRAAIAGRSSSRPSRRRCGSTPGRPPSR